MLTDLQHRIDVVRQKERRFVVLTGCSRSILVLIAVVLGYFLLDWIFDMPYPARLFCAVAGLGVVGRVIVKHVLRELGRIHDDDEFALRLEARNPDLHGRLISTLQLVRADQVGTYTGSPEMLAALGDETLRMAGPLDFHQIISTRSLKRLGIAAVLVLAIKVGLVVKFSDHFSALAARLVRADAHFPTRTRIKHLDIPAFIARGDDLQVRVTLDDKFDIPNQPGNLYLQTASNSKTSVELLSTGQNTFSAVLSKPVEDVDLEVNIGDAWSVTQRVKVLPRPEVDLAKSSMQCKPPAYVHLPDVPLEKFGGIMALSGSTVELTITSTKPLREAVLHRGDGVMFQMEKKDDQAFMWKLYGFALEKSGSFHLSLIDTDGIQNSRPPVEYPIDAKPDLQPVIKLLRPGRDGTVTPIAKPIIAFEARDDFGVRVVWLAYRVQPEGQSTESECKKFERIIDANLSDRKNVKMSFPLDVSALNVKVGDQIIFWLEADDDCASNDSSPMHKNIGAAHETAPEQVQVKVFSRSTEIRLTVVSREDKAQEAQVRFDESYKTFQINKEKEEQLINKLFPLLEKAP